MKSSQGIILLLLIFSEIRRAKLQVTFPDDPVKPTVAPTIQSTDTTLEAESSSSGSDSTMTDLSTMSSDVTAPNGETTASGHGGTPVCLCVTPGSCGIAGGEAFYDGSGKIEYRNPKNKTKVKYSKVGVVNNGGSTEPTGTAEQITTPASSGIELVVKSQTTCSSKTELCCTPRGFQCGLRYPPVEGSKNVTSPLAPFGSYPWQGIVFIHRTQLTSGALIDHRHFISVAHKFPATPDASQFTVRLGEWDLTSVQEPFPFKEFGVLEIVFHPNFNLNNSKNNLVILRLTEDVHLGEVPTITTGCLPSSPITGIRCWASGWYGPITKRYDLLREVDLPLVNSETCQSQLRKTSLGSSFVLDTSSFICAGSEAGKDVCINDSGSPLVCEIASQFYLTGLVAWGMDCGKKDVPGVYVNLQNFVPWIQSITQSFLVSKMKTTKKAGNQKATKPMAATKLSSTKGKTPSSSKATTAKQSSNKIKATDVTKAKASDATRTTAMNKTKAGSTTTKLAGQTTKASNQTKTQNAPSSTKSH